ncbi:hypothetical protein C3747_55g50 [Trypanosoma cruzi]|uniref:Uncharacterized protein n=2 Tax=Trypanosoma cruzi TaxID=5693 RepID=Q4DEY7_TRYCC|nr:hypothetical protein, conserved [Trypanosoma cruzi]EAN91084.1 hypothetical protein, conserved [Trypanosoma cruzi]PWV11917.1 hypothetical protein C3747_55g50 [Trypanosoma cruzi]RNC60487.1 hypothetical protein TcCL_ESM01832 [Trypanosoma cruzi]|eukprot:XP_812935.1 hypothetical protein [Trypanosoma cruzi strain CL Brener]
MCARNWKEVDDECCAHAPRPARFPVSKILVLCGFVVLFFVESCTVGSWPMPGAPAPTSSPAAGGPDMPGGRMSDTVLQHTMQQMNAISSRQTAPFLFPWGEERLAILKEWKQIYYSIRGDLARWARSNAKDGKAKDTQAEPEPGNRLQMLVYDVNDGYMTLSLASFFPDLFVTGVVLSGCPQSVAEGNACPSLRQISKGIENRWNTIQSQNNLENPRLFLCLSPPMSLIRLGNMAGRQTMAEYQVAVSLFENFAHTPTKRTFQRSLISFLKSASVATFITLPVFGKGPHKPKNVLHWYNQPHDPEQLMREAAELFSVQLSIVHLVSVRWGDEDRALFRVEVLRDSNWTEQETMKCEVRKDLLRCDPRGQFVKCSA